MDDSTIWISVPASGGAFDAYLALPPARHGPGLLLLQEIFGVNSHIRAQAEQYARDGFVVLAPDVFWRNQPRVELGYGDEDRARGRTLAARLRPELVLADLRAAVQTLRELPQTQAHKLGAIGWCMGGRLAYMAAALTEIDATVSYYGGGIHELLHLASGVAGPIQFHYAGDDEHIPPSAVDKVREAFAGRAAEVHVYPGAAHGFNCEQRPSYDPASAALAHGRSLAFLAQALF